MKKTRDTVGIVVKMASDESANTPNESKTFSGIPKAEFLV